jgi:hypothetical protein
MSEIISIQTEKGDVTPFEFAPTQITSAQKESMKAAIEVANAKKDAVDITALYWEAVKGETKTLVFLGFKAGEKTNKETGEKTDSFLAVFFDGVRQIVMRQMVIMETMMAATPGQVFKITCTGGGKGSVKTFEILT